MANILVVDDEQDVLETLPEILNKWGHQSFVARDGFEGLKIFQENEIDVVISDIRMPEMDGLELLQRVLDIDKHCMIIFLTGYPSLDTAVHAMQSGAHDYLIKPVNLDELKVRLERGFEHKAHIRSLPMLRGLNLALLLSIPIWLVLGIILARLLR